jgi:hypothetical protein
MFALNPQDLSFETAEVGVDPTGISVKVGA